MILGVVLQKKRALEEVEVSDDELREAKLWTWRDTKRRR